MTKRLSSDLLGVPMIDAIPAAVIIIINNITSTWTQFRCAQFSFAQFICANPEAMPEN